MRTAPCANWRRWQPANTAHGWCSTCCHSCTGRRRNGSPFRSAAGGGCAWARCCWYRCWQSLRTGVGAPGAWSSWPGCRSHCWSHTGRWHAWAGIWTSIMWPCAAAGGNAGGAGPSWTRCRACACSVHRWTSCWAPAACNWIPPVRMATWHSPCTICRRHRHSRRWSSWRWHWRGASCAGKPYRWCRPLPANRRNSKVAGQRPALPRAGPCIHAWRGSPVQPSRCSAYLCDGPQ